MAIGGFALGVGPRPDVMAVPSVPLPGGVIDSYRLDTTVGQELTAVVDAQGVTAQLALLDAGGDVLMQTDGKSLGDGEDVINIFVPAGTYTLQVQSLGGAGTYSLTTTSTPATDPLQPLPVGDGGYYAVAGDFNGDGQLDLAVANQYDDTVSILMGNGDGTFRPQVTYKVGAYPDAIVAGDFTGDGHLDLAVADRLSNQVSVLLGNGDGTFQPQVTYAVGSGPFAIVAGDFTGDGQLDLAVANQYDDTVSVLLGNGDGTFQPRSPTRSGPYPTPSWPGDFTGDGHLDLAVPTDVGGGVSVLMGNGDGTFQPQVTYASGSYPEGIVAGDFTGDGRLDLAVANAAPTTCRCCWATATARSRPRSLTRSGRYRTRSWRVTSTATAASTWPSPTAAPAACRCCWATATAPSSRRSPTPMGSDGTSIVTGRLHRRRPPRPGRRRWRRRRLGAAGQWRRHLPAAGTTVNAVGSDPRDRGRATSTATAASTSPSPTPTPATVSVLLGNGDGTFQPQVTYAVGTDPSAIVAGDFNGDGRLDLAVTDAASDTVSVLLGNGDGTFQPPGHLRGRAGPTRSWRGLHRRRPPRPRRRQLRLRRHRVGAAGQRRRHLPAPGRLMRSGTAPCAIVAGDFTGDGHLDLAVANDRSDDDRVGPAGQRRRHLPAPVTYAVGVGPERIVAGDFTGDGAPDLAVANNSGLANRRVDPAGERRRHVPASVIYAVGAIPTAIVAGDFTGDGRLDLAVADAAATSGVSVLAGQWRRHLRARRSPTRRGRTPTPSWRGISTATADLTWPSPTHRDNSVSVLLGNGDGTFTDPGQLATTPQATPVVADVNGDGTDDILVVDAAGESSIARASPASPGPSSRR